ncbi:MAG: G1 family glutamic endopeptidase [Chloroflexota bacterium]
MARFLAISLGPILLTFPLAASPAAAAAAPGPYRMAGDSSATSAIQAVIQKANQEQAQALNQNDPSVMQDTATTDYYAQLVQINRDLENSGVTAISLTHLTWGAVRVTPAGKARALTDETWQTTYSDGSFDQSTDPNVYNLVQQNGSWKIAADAHPGSQVEQPVPGQAATPPGPRQSLNWAGYEATGGTYSAVKGTWTVPQPSASASGADAAWVGIGGVTTRDLIQAGTEETLTGPGQVSYDAWVETLPHVSEPVPLAVHPGDSVSVSITQQSAREWLVNIANNTTGQSWQQAVAYDSSNSSAEWVEEAPSNIRGLVPLDGFGSVTFSGASAVRNGQGVSIAQAGAEPITMIAATGDTLASTSALASNGSAFTVTRSATPSAPAQGFATAPSMPALPTFPLGPGSGLSVGGSGLRITFSQS